jgi:hypothetical protein
VPLIIFFKFWGAIRIQNSWENENRFSRARDINFWKLDFCMGKSKSYWELIDGFRQRLSVGMYVTFCYLWHFISDLAEIWTIDQKRNFKNIICAVFENSRLFGSYERFKLLKPPM